MAQCGVVGGEARSRNRRKRRNLRRSSLKNRPRRRKRRRKLAKAQDKAEKAAEKATKAAEKEATAVQNLTDSWTGASIKTKEFLKAFKKLTPEQKKNDRILDKVLDKYNSMRKVLGPFNDELEHQWRMTERLNPELAAQRKETEKLDAAAKKLAEKALADLTKEQEKLKKAAEALNDRLENQRLRLLNLPTKKAIVEFGQLTQIWQDLSEAEKKVATPEFAKTLIDAAAAGFELNAAQLALIASSGVLTKEQEKLKKAADDLNDRLENQRRKLLDIPNDAAIREAEELTLAWEGLTDEQRAGEGVLGRYNSALDTINGTTKDATESASGYELALAGIAGKMGGATGQALNLVIAMREHNKAQDKAALASEKTEGKFSKMRMGAGLLGSALSAIGDKIGGTAGKVLSALGNIASAFATGGIVGAIIAGAVELGKALWSIFSGGPSEAELAGRKTAHEFREGVIAGLTEDQLTEVQLSWAEGWDSSVIIAVRDALIATGQTAEAARAAGDAMYDALWRAESEGPEAVQRVQVQIQAILDAAATAATDAAEAAAAAAAVIGAALEAALSAARARQDAEMSALKARQDAELGVLTSQIDAIENRLRPKVSELQALIDQQKSELESLSARQDAEMSAMLARQDSELASLASRRKAALDAISARQNAEMSAILSRQQAEMSGFNTQIDALESRLYPKISELEALLEQQKAELDALATRQDAQLAALATRRKAALDSIMAVQNEQLSILKESQRKELDEMKSAQAAELSALKAARNAQLSVVESAIQRELEDERIAAQLRIDLRKAGGDQEAIDAARARAAESTERLLERDELDGLMAKAEERVRARYKDELDTINAHWDIREKFLVGRQEHALTALEDSHATQITALESAQAAELEAHNDFWDDLEQITTLKHAAELTALETSHTEQMEALLKSLRDRQDTMETAHGIELSKLETAHTAELALHNAFFDALELMMGERHAAELTALEKYHAAELTALEAAHTTQLEALLDSLQDRRDAMETAHGLELSALESVHAAQITSIEKFWADALQADIDGRADRANAGDAAATTAVPEQRVHTPDNQENDYHVGMRQHGGPVSAGRRYLVGEAGPEMFVPSRSGRIDANGSSGGGGVDAKALAKAVADALEGSRVDVDGRQLGRLVTRHQPIAVAELGGRR